ncbi:hypothetical protein [Methylobacterium sp. UNCCL110]|jgi:hypothetical protein|nr:hypothetical protein [Methylobacterium sp. UNCCL110]SFU94175.1 hypothetical protein SAMN02799643_03305 [Methylobacterium sp. UNCCL125]
MPTDGFVRMVQQILVDQAADRLVEQGVRVTVASLGDALRRDGGGAAKGVAVRDLGALLADWKCRRRYREHLAVLDLPEDLERVLATVATALAASRPHVGDGIETGSSGSDGDRHPAGWPTSTHDRLAAMADDIGALREQVAALSQSRSKPPKTKREGRKRGLAAVMARLFWDRMMQHFVEAIRKEGPKTASELLATLDADALEMAESAFERIDTSLIAEKVGERVRRKNYFRQTPDGRYDAL